ncbi:hypothetical protein F4813DRAFT_394291 [Daldinia decipiens]|uniref:uncharacterized protein n=1 Tax=Daldinia decipiens TaxID=326647 RepID=UPI0020C23E9B|nr:uncharacterized protein F4813DRAFT_394291 [Daldinia decipiens]KAI1652842.1 hypothetical protein F4813DRAFT_394291 [Daldinia decipiens]
MPPSASSPAPSSDDNTSAKNRAAYLKATYTNSNSSDPSISSAEAFALSTSLSLPESGTTDHKTLYLRTLREAVSSLQDDVNSELTARMEKEAHEAAVIGDGKRGGKSITAAGVDEAVEEENYGEEVVEDDEE